MNDTRRLQALLGAPAKEDAGLRLAEVHSVLDHARVVVRFPSGALRRVYAHGWSAARPGATVLVQGERLLGEADSLHATTLYIP